MSEAYWIRRAARQGAHLWPMQWTKRNGTPFVRHWPGNGDYGGAFRAQDRLTAALSGAR